MRSTPESWRQDLRRDLERRERALECTKAGATGAFQRLKKIADEGPVFFCKQALGFEPTEYQEVFLKDALKEQFLALVWSRQSGKTQTVSAFLFWFAIEHDGSKLAVVGPSFRQTKLIVRKITDFLFKLPAKAQIPYQDLLIGRRPLKTKLTFINGSIIEAYPNNPDTIRGPTLQIVFIDEFNFVKDDEELYDAVLFTLGTTNGKFICSSTPWSRDHIFYRICKDTEFDDFKRSRVTWEQALEPKGPLKKGILEKIRKQLAADPWRWQRELEADWAEDDNVWLSQSLITSCIDPNMEIRTVDRQHSFWVIEQT